MSCSASQPFFWWVRAIPANVIFNGRHQLLPNVLRKKIALRGVLDIDGTFTVTIATPDANRKIFHKRIFPSMGST
jgi:hypothetical protein